MAHGIVFFFKFYPHLIWVQSFISHLPNNLEQYIESRLSTFTGRSSSRTNRPCWRQRASVQSSCRSARRQIASLPWKRPTGFVLGSTTWSWRTWLQRGWWFRMVKIRAAGVWWHLVTYLVLESSNYLQLWCPKTHDVSVQKMVRDPCRKIICKPSFTEIKG